MEAAQLRRIFLDYFAQNAHTVVPSASLIPHDPTLLFTVAGMVPFKPYYSGEETPPFKRAVSIQKCFRAADIDLIGLPEGEADFEVIQVASTILKSFGAKESDFVIRMNSRSLLNAASAH